MVQQLFAVWGSLLLLAIVLGVGPAVGQEGTIGLVLILALIGGLVWKGLESNKD